MMFFPVLFALVVVGTVVLVRRRHHAEQQRDAESEARLLRRMAFGAIAFSSAFGALFIAGETFTDPGGWAALGLVSLWAVPLAVVSVLAWRHPGLGVRVLGALVGAMVVVGVWFALDPQGWRDFEDSHGPVRAIATFAIAAALGLIGLRSPGRAGIELIVLSLVPPLLSSLGTRSGFSSLLAAATVPLIAGVLYLASAWVARRDQPRRRVLRARASG